MSQVIGESGRYVSQEVVRKRRNIIDMALTMVGVLCALWGFIVGSSFHFLSIPTWVNWIVLPVTLLAIRGILKLCLPKLDELEKERMNWQRGTDGENLVARELEKFPEDFKVINDLSTSSGDLDHVVIGPTGVFILETKNWRGVVSPDGNGELVLNGKPLDKPHIRQFLGRVMGTKDKITTLANGFDLYFQAVFVFTSARVEANWGTTKNVHCIRDEQLYNCIVENKKTKKLTKNEVNTIAQAFLGLAHMDSNFTERAGRKGNGRPRISAIVQRRDEKANPPQVRLTPSLGSVERWRGWLQKRTLVFP